MIRIFEIINWIKSRLLTVVPSVSEYPLDFSGNLDSKRCALFLDTMEETEEQSTHAEASFIIQVFFLGNQSDFQTFADSLLEAVDVAPNPPSFVVNWKVKRIRFNPDPQGSGWFMELLLWVHFIKDSKFFKRGG